MANELYKCSKFLYLFISMILLIFYLSSLATKCVLISLTEIIDYESRTTVTFN